VKQFTRYHPLLEALPRRLELEGAGSGDGRQSGGPCRPPGNQPEGG